ncbi:unnamed protein product [Cladocopium goreaui]|uniref:N-acetyltransferase domain-containing protein n=1 Tax=Cladocopium goreaui TaxID=2562237 RepID=A0A9P1G614_9DINO|nr:unnamed protein product [Cladocopium goreaui]
MRRALGTLAACVALWRPWSLVDPSLQLRRRQNCRSTKVVIGHRAVPWDQVPGAEVLSPEVLRAAATCTGEDFQLMLPEESDMQELTDLVDESFQRAIQARMVEDGNPFSGFWNGWVSLSERQMTLGALRKRLKGLLEAPSLRKPRDDEWALGVLLVGPQDGVQDGAGRELVGYFELLLQRPEGLSRRGEMVPYLKNLCVSKAYRGRGLGRKLLEVVEEFSRSSWKGESLYLHTDNDPAAFGLYNSSGYVVRKQEEDGEGMSIYMSKRLI